MRLVTTASRMQQSWAADVEREDLPLFKNNSPVEFRAESPDNREDNFITDLIRSLDFSVTTQEQNMELGAFSMSLAVKDIKASKAFYEKLGFTTFGGELSQNWLIMKNGPHVIGLFQGMFPTNTLTFNPGWDNNAQPLDSFADIRELQRHLKEQGVKIIDEVDESTAGAASFMLMDPDGNPILIDQHV